MMKYRYVLLFVLIAAVAFFLLWSPAPKRTEMPVQKSAKDQTLNQAAAQVLTQTAVISLDAQLKLVSTALGSYQTEQGQYPETLDALVPQYLRSPVELADPWGTTVRLKKKEPESLSIVSAGPDKIFGTADDIRRKIE